MYVKSFNPNFTIIYYFPKLLNITYYKSIQFEEVPEKTENQALLELKPPSGRFFPHFVGEENGQPPAQRANVALIPAAIKPTRLVANINQPEGISAFPVSPYHTTKSTKPATFSYTKYQPP